MNINISKTETQATLTNPQQPNYAQALRLLKNTDALIEKRKKQLRVQAMRAHRGSWMEHEEAHRRQIRQEANAEKQKTMQQYQEMKRKELQMIEDLKKRGEQSRKENMLNKSKSIMEAYQSKVRIKQQIRSKSKQFQDKIKEMRRQTIQMKKSRCINLYNDRKSSRIHVNDINRSRVSQIKRSVSRQRDELMQHLRRKKLELEKLNQEDISLKTTQNEKESLTTEVRSREQLPYRKTSSHIKDRKKSISQVKFDVEKRRLVYGSS